MIVDSYIHAWSASADPQLAPTPWLPRPMPYWALGVAWDEVEPEMVEVGVSALVAMQSTNSLRHTDELLAAATASRRPTKVIGWVPLTEPAETAAALRRYAHQPALAGVRHRLLVSENPELLLRPEVTESLRLVHDAGLVLDVLPWPPEVLRQIPTLVERIPGLPIVIDLLGWPAIAERRMQPWSDRLAEAAAHPKVFIKVAGLHRMAGARTDASAWAPYVATAVELFGAARIMIGSDWPPVTAFGHGYADAMRSILAAFSDLTGAERADVQAGTAARVYGISIGDVPPAR